MCLPPRKQINFMSWITLAKKYKVCWPDAKSTPSYSFDIHFSVFQKKDLLEGVIFLLVLDHLIPKFLLHVEFRMNGICLLE